MSRKQKRMGPVGCFGQIENIKRQSLYYIAHEITSKVWNRDCFIIGSVSLSVSEAGLP